MDLRHIAEFVCVSGAAMGLSALSPRTAVARAWSAMPASFVADFVALLLLGPHAAVIVTAAGAASQGIARSRRPVSLSGAGVTAAVGAVAVEAAGAVYAAVGATPGWLAWPRQLLPVAASFVAYAVVKAVAIEIVATLVVKRSVGAGILRRLAEPFSTYVIGAAIALGIAAVVNAQLWDVAAIAAAPLLLLFQKYTVHVRMAQEDERLRAAIAADDRATAVVRSDGFVTHWDAALERLVGCAADRAIGWPIGRAIPTLAKTALPAAIAEAQMSGMPRVVDGVRLSGLTDAPTLQVRVVPGDDAVTLLWQDVTELTRRELATIRREERLALAAAGANDGLWEWDLLTQEFFVSDRWKEILGLERSRTIARREQWLDRAHPEDLRALVAALDGFAAGKGELFQHECRLRHEDGTYRRVLCRGVARRGAGGRTTRIAGSLTDTTERALAQEELRNAGFLDPLTGLCNRSVFVEGLGRRLDELKKVRGGPGFAALYLDLDRFKVVNDSLGHLVGDELLRLVSRRLESILRQGDSLGRLGGDEFAILLNTLMDEQQANAIAFRIQDALSAPFMIDGREVFTSASIGIAFGRASYESPDEIMRDADAAMYHAKSRGKARHELFDADMHARVRDRLGFENDLRHAVSHNAFEVHYQPIVSLGSGMCVGFESLVRWTRNGEAVSPAKFIPIAEELGLVEALGASVLQQACRKFAEWQRRYPNAGLDCITVNVSSRQLAQQNFAWIVEEVVQAAGLKPRDLRLEITETALMESTNAAAEVLRELRDFGVKIYLDDFGTGYSSLSHLHRLPVDALKIDRSFVTSLALPDRSSIVESILALARTLNTHVVAEGIESEVQADALEQLGCTHAQGYLFSRPVTAEAAEAIISAGEPLRRKKVAAITDADVSFYSPKPFEWPSHIPSGRLPS